MCAVDLTRIEGIEVTTALAVVSEVGADLSRFPSDKRFASWIGLCPKSATWEVFLERHHVAWSPGNHSMC